MVLCKVGQKKMQKGWLTDEGIIFQALIAIVILIMGG